ncbi:MAG: glycosyltransferase family 9 protein [Spirulinaceae cyanobacterium]
MRILALVPGGIGDQILFFPTLADLKQHYEDATIDVMVELRAKSAYRVCQSVHEVLTFNFPDRNGMADYLNLLGVVRDREYDIAISVGNNWTVGLLLWLNGIPVRVGYQVSNSWFLTSAVPLKTEQYAAYRYHDLLQGLGIHTPCPQPQVNVPKQDIAWAEEEQKSLGIAESGYILLYSEASKISPSKGINKIYPVTKWQQVVEDIHTKQPELPIVLLQSPDDDEEWLAMMKQACPNLKVIVPGDIGKLAATIAGANLMLCTDSAPLYLSLAVGTYTIALFGLTEAKKRLPPNSESCVGIQSPTQAIADIEPQQILEQMWRS